MRLVKLEVMIEQVVLDGPMGVTSFLVFCSVFLMREIEASLVLTSHVHLNWETIAVTVTLPASKNDIEGVMVSRSLGAIVSKIA